MYHFFQINVFFSITEFDIADPPIMENSIFFLMKASLNK